MNTLAHRGPDQWGDLFEKGVYLGHRRLSILDLSPLGRQPMTDITGQVSITVNGEIYNYKELKKDLQNTHHFISHSDSEVLLHGYRNWGVEMLLNKIDGMFAFCIYDKAQQKIYLARDHTGIKPLYYAVIGDIIAWASELKAIESFFGKNNLEVDQTALYDFLTYRYVPTPKTLFKNVWKLEPAHYLEIDLNKNKTQKYNYWKLTPANQTISRDDARNHLKQLIKQSVTNQLISDVPLGFFLSGGIDSSVIVSEAAHISQQVHTYSIGFDVKQHDETHFAELIAAQFKTQHHSKVLDKYSAQGMFDKLKSWYDEPFADTSAFPTFLVCEFAKEHCTVVLTGDGGDEVFGGYSSYFRFKELIEHRNQKPFLTMLFFLAEDKIKRHWSGRFNRKVYAHILSDEVELFAYIRGRMLKPAKIMYKTMFQIPEEYDDYWHFRRYYIRELPLLTRLQYLDFHTLLPDDILTKVDRVSMAVGLEARVPLLSKDIIEFSFSLPEDVRFCNNTLKGLLKYAYNDTLPSEILHRKKKGFSIPVKSWGKTLLNRYNTAEEFILRTIYAEELRSAAWK